VNFTILFLYDPLKAFLYYICGVINTGLFQCIAAENGSQTATSLALVGMKKVPVDTR